MSPVTKPLICEHKRGNTMKRTAKCALGVGSLLALPAFALPVVLLDEADGFPPLASTRATCW